MRKQSGFATFVLNQNSNMGGPEKPAFEMLIHEDNHPDRQN
jgi:hypothetical protein